MNYLIIEASEAREPLPRGLYSAGDPAALLAAYSPQEGTEKPATELVLVHLPTGRKHPLKDVSAKANESDVELKADGYKLRLRPVGESNLTAEVWAAVGVDLLAKPVQLMRLPTGSSTQITIDEIIPTKQGCTIRYKEKQAHGSLQLTAPAFVALRWEGGALEARTEQGTGLRLYLRLCKACGSLLTSREEDELCRICLAAQTRENRAAAQKQVGVCRGCLSYGISEDKDISGRAGICLNAARVKALGQPTEKPVKRCLYRKARKRGTGRRRLD